MAAHRRVYDSRHLADSQVPGSAPESLRSVIEYGLPLPFTFIRLPITEGGPRIDWRGCRSANSRLDKPRVWSHGGDVDAADPPPQLPPCSHNVETRREIWRESPDPVTHSPVA